MTLKCLRPNAQHANLFITQCSIEIDQLINLYASQNKLSLLICFRKKMSFPCETSTIKKYQGVKNFTLVARLGDKSNISCSSL